MLVYQAGSYIIIIGLCQKNNPIIIYFLIISSLSYFIGCIKAKPNITEKY
ncbi:MAG: hypothetical protein F6K54_05015 [Okeania sp. SIO3B5]|nr:hypothetical protein [Okeania sp. SIO3B5]NEO52487.1 hypothetical protein [Okeania sp. SIO3B5]